MYSSRLFQMKTSIFGWETKFGFVLPSHKRRNPSIYAKHINAPGTNGSRPICKRFLNEAPETTSNATVDHFCFHFNVRKWSKYLCHYYLVPNSGVETNLRFSKCRLGEHLLGNQSGMNLVFKYNIWPLLSYGYRKRPIKLMLSRIFRIHCQSHHRHSLDQEKTRIKKRPSSPILRDRLREIAKSRGFNIR